MIVDRIIAFLAAKEESIDQSILFEVAILARTAFERQFLKRKEKERTLRLSSIGHCLRQQAYNILGFETKGKEIDARARMVFFMGDLVEIAILQLAKAAGCKIENIGQYQAAVELDGVPGHPDGILTLDNERILVETKSMSSYSFKEFERGVIEPGYRFQINAYMQALGLSRTIVIGLNKDAGVMHEAVISKDNALVSEIRDRIATLKKVTKEKLPERPYQVNDKGFYPWQCRYCSHYETCLPNAELVLVSNVYKLKEKQNDASTP